MPEIWFTEEEKMFQDQMRKFATKELAPGAAERANMREMSKPHLEKVGALGVVGIGLPEKYGGVPGSNVMLGIATEEFGKADGSMGMIMVNRSLTAWMMYEGNESIRALLPDQISLKLNTCACITEPDCGSDVAAIKTKAERDGDEWVLTGQKTSATFGMDAESAVVFANTRPEGGPKGLSCFFIRDFKDNPNVERSLLPDMGCLPVNRAVIHLDGVRIPAEHILGGEGQAFVMLMKDFNIDRVLNALGSLGLAQTSLDEAIEYVKIRHAFGNPISKYQGVSFQIAEDATRVQAGRLLCYNALKKADEDLSIAKEGAMAKWFCNEVAFETIHHCLLLHGHTGYSEETPVQMRLRDSIGWEIADGGLNVQKLIIARALIGRNLV